MSWQLLSPLCRHFDFCILPVDFAQELTDVNVGVLLRLLVWRELD